MNASKSFDPCQTVRTLLEMLFENGLLTEALTLAQRVDDLQLRHWADEKSAAAAGA